MASSFRSDNAVLSGSLTKLSDGTSYLIAGAGIDITTGSNGSVTITNNGEVGDITNVIAGTGLSGGGTSGEVTLVTNDSEIVHDNLSGFVSNEHIDHSTVSISGNNGITGGGDLTTNRTLSLDFSSLTDMTGDITGATEFILQNGTAESRKAASEIKLSNFNNDSGWTNNVGTITGVTAGSGLTGGGTAGSVPISVDSTKIPFKTNSNTFTQPNTFQDNLTTNSIFQVSNSNLNLYSNPGTGLTLIGESQSTLLLSPGNASDVRILLSGSVGSKDGINRGVTLVAGDMVVSGSLYDGLGNAIGVTINNNINNRILTATGTENTINGESNLEFNGSTLILTGSLEMTSNLNLQPTNKINFNTPGTGDQYIQYTGNILTIESDDYLNVRADDGIDINVSNTTTGYINIGIGANTLRKDQYGSYFNRDNDTDCDFVVDSINNDGILFVDAGLDVVILGASDLTGQGDGPNELWPYGSLIGNDVRLYFSGSAGSKDSATRGVTLVTGDLVISGSTYDKNGKYITKTIENSRTLYLNTTTVTGSPTYYFSNVGTVQRTTQFYDTQNIFLHDGIFDFVTIRFSTSSGSASLGNITISILVYDQGKSLLSPTSSDYTAYSQTFTSAGDHINQKINFGFQFNKNQGYHITITPTNAWNSAGGNVYIVLGYECSNKLD